MAQLRYQMTQWVEYSSRFHVYSFTGVTSLSNCISESYHVRN